MTQRSLHTCDRAVAEQRKHGVIQAIKDYHARLIKEAEAGVQGFGDEVMGLRQQVEDGSMDSSDAVVLAHDLLEAKPKALGKSAEDIESMTAEDIPATVKEPFRLLRDSKYLPLSAAIKEYLDLIEDTVTPRTWGQKKLQPGDVNVNDIDRRVSSRYINECMVPKGQAPKTNQNNVAILGTFFN